MLRGEHVILRAFEREDMKTLHELQKNVDLVLLSDGEWEPWPLAASEKHFEKHLEDQERSGFIIEVDGVVIGGCGLHHSHRRDGSTQFGIGIHHPEYVGKGYGPDAIRVLLRWAFHVQNWRRVWLTTLACNERALRAYQKLGFVEEGRLREESFFDGKYVDVLQMGMLRREWEARQ
ncbi:MAG: GNAT family protein [Kouleothrix sp.]